ncbi:MAG: division/cell wall cluster transcriptional repressor MraZ [Treponema sp.]|nr:division/cell wall cluster transcriptional repressor MraZ [Treponema sp.]
MEINPKKGTLESTLDDKGRVVIPASLRDYYSGMLMITRGVEHCLWVMTTAAYEKFLEKFKKESKERNLSSEEIMAFYYQHESTAQSVEIDPKTGRIPIPAVLRSYANLTKDCLIVSIKGHLEIWNAELNKAFMDEVQAINKNIHKKLFGQINFFSDEGQE